MANGVHPHTAYRWFREGTLPVPAERVQRTILVNIEANSSAPSVTAGVGLYARVSSHDQKSDLERQVSRLAVWAARGGHRVVRIESEIGSGMNGGRAKARRLLADPEVSTVVVDDGEVADDLVRDMVEVLTSFCARLYGRRSAKRRAEAALEAAAAGD